MSDTQVDAERIQTLIRYKAAFSKPEEEFLAELEAVLAPDATYEFLGIGKYVGPSDIGLMLTPTVTSGLLVAGLPVSMAEIGIDAVGFTSKSLNEMYVLSSEATDTDDAELTYVQGSFVSLQFVSCSGTIKSVFKALDDFSFGKMTTLLEMPTSYGGLEIYDQTLLRTAASSIFSFDKLRSNECVEGIFVRSKHMYKVVGDSSTPCVVLGETSYFKVAYDTTILKNEVSFAMKYVTPLKTITSDGTLKYAFSDEGMSLEMSSGGRKYASMQVDATGAPKCISIFMAKFCLSMSEEEAGDRRLMDADSGKLYLEVDGNKTDAIVLRDGLGDKQSSKSNQAMTGGNSSEFSAGYSASGSASFAYLLVAFVLSHRFA
jgi:hypothetical protein